MKKIVLVMIMCAGVLFANAQLIKRDFLAGYNIGQNLEKGFYATTTSPTPLLNQWNGTTADASAGTVSPTIAAPLTYVGYVESGKDYAAQTTLLASSTTRTSGYSLANSSLYNSGCYYLAFMVNFSQINTSNFSDFFSLDQNFFSNARRNVIYITKGSDANKFKVAIAVSTSSAPNVADYEDAPEYNIGETYLFVFKQDFDNKTAKLFINPVIANEEPVSATLSIDVTTGGINSNGIRAINIRQRATYEARFGGFRFAKTWEDALGQGETDPNDYTSKEIIHEQFNAEPWDDQPAYGNFNYTIKVGTGTGIIKLENCMINTKADPEGVEASSPGRTQLRGKTTSVDPGIIELPEISSCGNVKINANAGNISRIFRLQKYVNGSWNDLTTFTTSSAYADGDGSSSTACKALNFSYDVRSAKPIKLRIINDSSSSLYVYEVWVTDYVKKGTSVKQTIADKGAVVATRYYTLTGVRVQEPTSGIFIQQSIYENGAIETVKILRQ
ncbi:MAG: hypothetical protein LBI82_09795 [Dysgonamonadaceae bacterium]|nr:hypothetical protein [Dysgonamonadaceae bacterium]